MEVVIREVGKVVILGFNGRITLGEGSQILRDTISWQVSLGRRKIVLNLGDVTYIDSSGIQEMVSSFVKVTNSGGALKLSNLTKRTLDLLQTTKLYTVFEVHNIEADAVKSFK